jgi:hypothetical protein
MFSRKVSASISAGLLFFIISSPFLYKLVDSIVGSIVGMISPSLIHILRIAESGRPTTYGLAVHSVVFALVAYWMMQN